MRPSLPASWVYVSAAALLGLAAPSGAQEALSHQPAACLVAGKYPRLVACIQEPDAVASARVFFRAAGTSAWYHVVMAREEACFAAALPKPRPELVGKRVDYYIEADHRRLGAPRTAENHPLVVRSSGECVDLPAAAFAAGGPSAVFPALPSGFAAGGLGTGAIVAIVGGGLAAGGTAVAVGGGGGGGDDGGSGPTATTTPPPITTVPPPTSTLTPPGETLAVTCDARPDSGGVPLTVQFRAGATGVAGRIDLRWDFGDGEGADGPAVEHVYRSSGRFEASVRATSGGLTERCARTIAVAVPPTRKFPLSVSRAGTGEGDVNSSPGGIACGETCSADFEEGTTVRLTPKVAGGSVFRGWSGACSGSGACSVTLNAAQGVTATFDRVSVPQRVLTVRTTGSGRGTVVSSPAGIDCGSDCTEPYATGTAVTLTAQKGAGSTFDGWSGACSGTGGCTVTMNADASVSAAFGTEAAPTFRLSLVLVGRGTGTVTGPGINCPGDCTEEYPQGTAVNITAARGPNSTFSGWEQDCFGQSNICQLTMNAAHAARARFDAQFRLDVTVQGPGRVTGPQIDCPPNCTAVRVDGALEPLTAVPNMGARLAGWAGDCSGTATTCDVTMDQNRSVLASFVLSVAEPADGPRTSAWRSHLDEGNGIVRVGPYATSVAKGDTLVGLPAEDGEVRVELELPAGAPPTVWRLESQAPDIVEPGTVRVLAGAAVEVGPGRVAFRLRGGERAAFTFRTRTSR